LILSNIIKNPNPNSSNVKKLNLNIGNTTGYAAPHLRFRVFSQRREYCTSTKNNQTTYNQLGSYLAGLIEGDGNIYTPGLNVKEGPKIEIVFDIRDFELFKKIQSVIGGGTLYIRPNLKSGRITFKKKNFY